MAIMKIETFCITGITVRTSNAPGMAEKDIPQLWNRFFAENIINQLLYTTSNDIYCVYTQYETDYTGPYTAILGCRVEKSVPAPAGFASVTIEAGNYNLFTAKGNLQEGVVFNEWTGIWQSSLKRSYTTDFEVYGKKAHNPASAEVDIFIAID
ncbi:MAG: effector binding domain-containing protein [Chitinophagaceae bacterium]